MTQVEEDTVQEGGLMGNLLMVALFWVAFRDALAACCGRKGSGARTTACMVSLVGWRIDLSQSQYAEDTTKQIVAELGEGVPGACEMGEVLQ